MVRLEQGMLKFEWNLYNTSCKNSYKYLSISNLHVLSALKILEFFLADFSPPNLLYFLIEHVFVFPYHFVY